MGGAEHGRDRLPIVVGLVCVAGAAALFLTNTVPALRESEDLQQAEEARLELLEKLVHQSRELRDRQRALEWDPQSVLMEIDALGLTPAELLAEQSDANPASRQ